MNPMLAASLEWTAPEGAAWLAALSAFLGAGCCIVCVAGLVLLLREALRASGGEAGSPLTWQSEFMGYGIAKERFRPRPAGKLRRRDARAAACPASPALETRAATQS